MKAFHRLHALRMENDAAKYAMDELRPRFERLAGRHENGTAPRVVTAYQLFQTPPELAARLVALLDLKPGARVLEPSAGLGRLLDALRPYEPREVVAVEIASQCAAELYQQDRPGVTIKQRDFLTLSVDDLGTFDAVVMNPPFHMRSDIRHIEHALRFVRPGGRLAAICLDGYQRREALGSRASQWIDVPPGTFKEAGTNVATSMIIIDT